jgi:hypothetical protein
MLMSVPGQDMEVTIESLERLVARLIELEKEMRAIINARREEREEPENDAE